MTLQEISELTIEKVFADLFNRIIDLSNLPAGSPAYQMDLDENKSFYDRVIVHQSLVKPSLELFEAELEELKSELNAIENARLAEIARVDDINSRFNAIPDIRGAIVKASLDIPNPAIELKRIIEENDQDRLSALEASGAQFDLEYSKKLEIDSKVAIGSKVKSIAEGLLSIISAHVIENNFTDDDDDTLIANHGDIFQALQSNRITKAKGLIQAIMPDGTLVTSGLKQRLLDFYAQNGM